MREQPALIVQRDGPVIVPQQLQKRLGDRDRPEPVAAFRLRHFFAVNLQLFIDPDRLPGPADIFPRQAEQLPAAQACVITNSQGDGCVRPGAGYHPPELVGGYGKPFLFLPVLFYFNILNWIDGDQAVWFNGSAE